MLNTFKSILKWFVFIWSNYCNRMHRLTSWWEGMEKLDIFTYCTVTVACFTDQNWITKTVYCIRCVMVCKIGFTNWNAKIALLRASMVVTYYIKLFRTGTDRHNGILMSLLLLVAETKQQHQTTYSPRRHIAYISSPFRMANNLVFLPLLHDGTN